MKKRMLAFLLCALMVLAMLPAAGAAEADTRVSGDIFTETLTTDLAGVKFDTDFNMVFVEGGTFTLGWESSDASMRPENVNPVRNVTVSDFYIGETEVTVSMWNAVMGLNKPGTDANRPKEFVSFYQTQEFLTRLYYLTGRTYRLATEAEWEFAAKGGNPGKTGNAEYPGNNHKYLFAGSNDHDEVVASKTVVANVKTKKPNILGIYDLCGNAEEWVYNTWDSNYAGGVDPVGPGGHFHQQKTRRGGTYGAASSDSTRTIVGRQIRSIDGAAGMGFRIALSGDMNSVPAGMVRPKDVVHPSIDETNLPVTYRDQRVVTGDAFIWESDAAGMQPFTMKLWDTGEMVIRAPGYADRVGQWYTVSNLGIVLVENAFEENEKRLTMPYMFMTEDYVTIVNDESFTGTGAPVHRMEKKPDEGSGIEKPTGLTLYDPEKMAAASEHDHTSYDLYNITPEMKGKDERLIDGDGYGWWLSSTIGIHQYRQDFTNSIFRFVVYSPAFGSGSGGADVGYGGNYLAQGTWYTINDMLLVVGSGSSERHYLYAITDEVNSYIRSGQKVHQLLEISYMGYERGDPRYLELHPNSAIRGYSKEIPTGFLLPPEKPSSFLKGSEPETMCPGGCGQVISKCACPTVCPTCHEHLDNCYCNDTPARLDAAVTAAQAALADYTAANTATQAHLDAVARTGIGYHNIERSWTGFQKTNATREKAGSITGTLKLSLNGSERSLDVSVPIPQLPETKPVTLTPHSTVGGKVVTMTASGMDEYFTLFDIGSIYGMPGLFGYTYAMWFDKDGTFTFDQDVTLSRTYFEGMSFTAAGTDTIPVKAGETVKVADGVYSEYQKKNVAWSEFSVTLDDGNSWMIVYAEEPGNYGAFPPDTPLTDFPVRSYNPDVTVKGAYVAWTDAAPFIDANSRTMVPLRAVGETLGLTVDWDSAAREASFTDGVKTIYFPIDSKTARASDGSTVEMDTAAVIVDSRTYAPIRYLAEFFGYEVGWDGAARTVIIK